MINYFTTVPKYNKNIIAFAWMVCNHRRTVEDTTVKMSYLSEMQTYVQGG